MAAIDDKTRWDFLYREWEYRHKVIWTSFNLWGFIVSVLIAAPFIKIDLFDIGWSILAIPAFGCGVSIFAAMHLLTEAKRMALVFARFSEFRGLAAWPHPVPAIKFKHRIQELSIAKILGNVFLYVMIPCCFSSMIVQSVILFDRYGSPFEFSNSGFVRFASFSFAILLPIIGARLGLKRALAAMERKRLALTPQPPR